MPKTPSDDKLRAAFQQTAESCGGDILQCCIDCGTEPRIDREDLYDYIHLYGGKHAKEVAEWIIHPQLSLDDIEAACDDAGVPRYWT